MRQPSTEDQLFAWWRDALAGLNPPRHDGHPQCGWYRTRLKPGAPWVPARIWCEREIDPETGELTEDERFVCEVDGERRDAARVWLHLKPISELQYDALLHLRETIPAMRATMVKMDLVSNPMRPQ
jgi:hypothetical protein